MGGRKEWGGRTALAAVVTTSEIYIEHYKASFGEKMIDLRRPRRRDVPGRPETPQESQRTTARCTTVVPPFGSSTLGLPPQPRTPLPICALPASAKTVAGVAALG